MSKFEDLADPLSSHTHYYDTLLVSLLQLRISVKLFTLCVMSRIRYTEVLLCNDIDIIQRPVYIPVLGLRICCFVMMAAAVVA